MFFPLFFLYFFQYADGGVYVIKVTINDGEGGVAAATTTSMITGVMLIDGVLQIVGTDDDDHVTINKVGKSKLRVHADFLPGRKTFVDFRLSDVTRIDVWLCDGDDHYNGGGDGGSDGGSDGGADIAISQNVLGGAGNNLLFGGQGKDKLQGGRGSDILIGGDGRDDLKGDHGDDLLIGGDLDVDWEGIFEMDALDIALTEWASGDLADTMNILGNVMDDDDKDKLFGNTGVDTLIRGIGDKLKH